MGVWEDKSNDEINRLSSKNVNTIDTTQIIQSRVVRGTVFTFVYKQHNPATLQENPGVQRQI